MKILICASGEFGGTDFLLTRYYEWLIHKSIKVDIVVPSDKNILKVKCVYDLVILPSSQMHYLPGLKLNGYNFKRILIWIMGCGSFSDTYYNSDRSIGIESRINFFLDYVSKKFVRRLYRAESICFTDEVGMAITFQGTDIAFNLRKKNNLIPIAIKLPSEKLLFDYSQKKSLRFCWIGRVSRDFKFIPLVHFLNDIEIYMAKRAKKISLTIIGDGDGISEIKKLAKTKAFSIDFKDRIEYEKIGKYLETNVDILVGMGTSALDGAKYGCPSIIITPVKPSDEKIVHYRWIFDSKGYSLGEYSHIKVGPVQPKLSFEKICDDYFKRNNIGDLSYEYAKCFDENFVFNKLLNRSLPTRMNLMIWFHLYLFVILKKIKTILKKTKNCRDKICL